MKWILAVLVPFSAFAASVANAEDFKPFPAVLNETAPLNSTSAITNPELLPCIPLAGTHVNVVEQAAHAKLPQFVSRIEVLEGQCKGVVGWVITSRLRTSN